MSGTGKIAALVKAKGIAVNESALPVKMGFLNYAGSKGGVTLSDKQLRLIADFVKRSKPLP